VETSVARATFTGMEESTAEDWAVVGKAFVAHGQGLADRVLAHLKLLDGDFGGFAVDRLTHSLQTATRAFRAGEDEEYVVCALLHDIGDTLGSYNHADVAAAILQPFVSEENHWMVAKHAIFQGYYFFHHVGLDRDAREAYRGHPLFGECAAFCARYDQNSFDPGYDTLPLAHFEPIVRKVFAAPKQSLYVNPETGRMGA
jgi:predicted HD phosphohydrolase